MLYTVPHDVCIWPLGVERKPLSAIVKIPVRALELLTVACTKHSLAEFHDA